MKNTILFGVFLLVIGLVCGQEPTSVCELEMDPGPCKAHVGRFFYNFRTEACQLFIYGGCKGNDNRFKTLAECQSTCIPDSGPDSSSVECFEPPCEDAFVLKGECWPMCPDVCELEMDPGPCKAHEARFFYNFRTEACQLFIYGGCKGNDNRFKTLAECQSTCIPDSGPDSSSVECVEPPCEDAFVLKGECWPMCPDVCELEMDPGPCKAHEARFFYNFRTEACQLFIYGGCKGNDNRFKSLAECQSTCIPDSVPDSSSVECVEPPCEDAFVLKGECWPMCPDDEDRCMSNPCLNGATCLNRTTGFECFCGEGFTGDLCQHDEDRCDSNTCLNGTTCLNLTTGFECICGEGFTGNLSQHAGTSCIDIGGLCLDIRHNDCEGEWLTGLCSGEQCVMCCIHQAAVKREKAEKERAGKREEPDTLYAGVTGAENED